MPHRIDFLFCGFRDIPGLSGTFICHSLNICTGCCNFPQHAFIPDNPGIFPHTGSSRGDIHQLGQVSPSSGFIIGSIDFQFIEHRHRVNAQGIGKHRKNGLKNAPVFFCIEVLRTQKFNYFRNTGWVNQHGTDDRLFRFNCLWHLPCQQIIHCHIRLTSFLLDISADKPEGFARPKAPSEEGAVAAGD